MGQLTEQQIILLAEVLLARRPDLFLQIFRPNIGILSGELLAGGLKEEVRSVLEKEVVRAGMDNSYDPTEYGRMLESLSYELFDI